MDLQQEGTRSFKPSTKIGLTMLVLVLLGSVVGMGTWSAFSDTTENPGNNWTAGTVTITDDDGDSAMFSVSEMAPGDTVTRCIVVTYEGSITPADVSLYGALDAGSGLEAFLNMDVDLGTGGTFGDCSSFTEETPDIYSGTLDDFTTNRTDFATGVQAWSPSGTPESKTYRFNISLQDDNNAQGLDATATFTWEAQSQ